MSLLGSVAPKLASRLMLGITEKIGKRFGSKDSEAGNGGLQKLLAVAVREALANILALYGQSGATAQEKREAAAAIKLLQKELLSNLASQPAVEVEANIKDLLRSEENAGSALTERILAALRSAGVSPDFGQFVAQHLPAQAQLCFGEALRNPANHSAQASYQQMLSEEMHNAVSNIERMQQELQAGMNEVRQSAGGLSPEQMEEISQLKELLKNPPAVAAGISHSMASLLKSIEAKEDELIRTTTETNLNVKDIKAMVKHLEARQRHLLPLIYGLVAALVVAAGSIGYYTLRRPFTATLHVYGWQGAEHNPLDGKGFLTLTLGDKVEQAGVGRDGKAIFKEVPASYSGCAVPVRLVDFGSDPYYLTDSMVMLHKGEISELQVLLRGLEKLEGVVVDEDGVGIAGASVWVAGRCATTNERGHFIVAIPLNRQQQHHEVEITKDGYLPYRNSAMPMAGGGACRLVLGKR
jgi:hypothetical protein